MSAKPETKMAKATKIYKKMINLKGIKRKHIIEKFQSEAGLTKLGSGTYYSIIKNKLAGKS